MALGSDCPVRFCTGIGREYEVAARYQRLALNDLLALTLNGVDAAFLPPSEKAVLRAGIRAEYERLTAG